MTDPDGDLARRVAILAEALADLERDEASDEIPSHRRPTAEELRRVADEVTIPAAVAAVETNRRVLERLEEHADEGDDGSGRRTDPDVETPDDDEPDASEDELDASEDEPDASDDEVARILERAADLQADVEAHLDAARAATGVRGSGSDREPVPVDVDAEIEAIRREIDERSGYRGEDRNGSDEPDGGD